jgi:protein SCO1/2
MLRVIRWAASLLVVVLLCGWAAVWLVPADHRARLLAVVRAVGGVAGEGSSRAAAGGLRLGGPFTAVDQHGNTVTDQTFRGRWMLVYFGYTYCPDVCPTELQTVAGALGRLGPEAAQIAPVFVTVDPDRDKPAVLADYVRLFDDRLIGLTGSAQQIRDIATAYRVYYAKVKPEGATEYLMDHSAFLYLMGPDGSFQALVRPGGTAADLADVLRSHLHSWK